MKNEIFANRMKELRIKNDLSLRELARDLNLSPSIICYYENGDKMPSNANLVKIATYFRVSSDYLLGTQYFSNEQKSEDYLKDEKLLKIIRRSEILSNYLLKDTRKSVETLEKFIQIFDQSQKK